MHGVRAGLSVRDLTALEIYSRVRSIAVDNDRFASPWLTRRAFLETAIGAVAAYGVSRSLTDHAGLATTWAASDFKLRAPGPSPKYGGVLRYGIPSTPAHFDVHQSGTVNNLGTQGCMYDNLTRRDPRDSGRTIIPDLAHSWEISQDGKTYPFFLRRGVTLHDGATFTAEAETSSCVRKRWRTTTTTCGR
jgi:peptide/nickel transport system substrate-binding protein